MERSYREVTLKRKKRIIQLGACALFFFLFWQSMLGAPKTFIKKAIALGTNYMQPAIIRFMEAEEEEVDVPILLQLFAPAIVSYTWQEAVPVFSVIEIVKKEAEDASYEKINVTLEAAEELSLLQENLYVHSKEEDHIFTEGLEEVLDTDSIKPHQSFQLERYYDTTQLIKDFYVIDASTSADTNLLDIDKLTSYDCRLDKSAEGPQILIYHSHSQEGFIDSVAGDESTTIVGAGEKLTRLLEEEYGYDVLHHDGVYDVPSRDNAYSNALPDVERVLAENPTIQIVIDLHRDAVAEGRKLVTTIDGKDYARFMFFNGICRSTNGPITYLSNPYLQENMAFSFQSQLIAESYFPGITRKIYLKAWRYNMHFKPRNMLIELGAQTNTVEEIMNTTEILAFVIDKVLSGQ